MTWEEALNLIKDKQPRFETLCAEDNPDKEFWRAEIIKRALGEHKVIVGNEPNRTLIPPKRENSEKPSILNQIKSASTAAMQFITGGTVSQEEQERRLKICQACEHFTGSRCDICNCYMKWKVAIEKAHCPLSEPKW